MSDNEILPDSAPLSIRHSESLDQLGAALAKAQSEITGAKKDSSNPFFKSCYADLASVQDACRLPLSKAGIAVIQMPTNNGRVGLTTMLLHASGQWIASTCHAHPKDDGPQAVASVVTMLRRYGLSAMAGVSAVDDDGEAGEGRDSKPPSKPNGKPVADPAHALPHGTSRVISEAQAKRLFAVAKSHQWPESEIKARLALYGYQHSKDVQVNHYDDIVSAFEQPYEGAVV